MDNVLGTHFRATPSSLNAHASGPRGTGDDDDFSLQGEEVVERLGFGNGDHCDGDEGELGYD